MFLCQENFPTYQAHEPETEDASIQGALAAGFVVLNENLAIVGLVIVILIIFYFILRE